MKKLTCPLVFFIVAVFLLGDVPPCRRGNGLLPLRSHRRLRNHAASALRSGRSIGELYRGFGMRVQPYQQAFRPNQIVTFLHPATGRNATIPLTLPEGTPRYDTRPDRIVYNYGSYVVEVRFFNNGAIEVRYNSGFLRPLQVQ